MPLDHAYRRDAKIQKRSKGMRSSEASYDKRNNKKERIREEREMKENKLDEIFDLYELAEDDDE